MLLQQWQSRLDRHFASLSHKREGSGYHLFALEHGLNDNEIEEVSSLLRSSLQFGSRLSSNWLLWIVYATEQGYKYEGDEYWPSFENQTPLWENRNRYQLSRWFKRFQNTYYGVVPSGRWADHFRIISRPITHAILPRYLQIQFARTLFDLRYRLARLPTLEPAHTGRLLATYAHHAPTRFQEFLQQEELTGRIVHALLGEGPPGGREPIYPPTLQRIVEDLERVRNTREWLRETRRFVKDRFKGIASGLPRPASPIPPRVPQSQDDAKFGVRPSILLGHRGGGTWSVWLEVPPFRNVATPGSDIQSFLKRTRCRLNGADDVKPAGWLLSGNRKGFLKSWPDLRRPLIQFEKSHGRVDNILETECRLDPGPFWLFRIADDGSARQIANRIVRPGNRYIVITTEELPEPHSGMSACHIDCANIKAFRLQVPAEVSAEDTVWLSQLNLQVARTIRVWPAGLPGRGWDGEGRSEWLTTEAPCFGIVHDHPVDAYALCLNDGAETEIESSEMGHPVFVRLEPLPVGTHTLTVKVRRSASLTSVVPTPAAEGFVDLHVREPEPWIPGLASHTGLIATLDPHDADLDTFWRNQVSLSVLGPESRSVTLVVSLKDRNGEEILSEQIGNPMELPVLPDAWRERFARFLKPEKNTWSYLEAATGQLEIRGEELGKYSFRFEHDIVPLRWVVHRDHDNIFARLIDDTGIEESEPEVRFFNMERPLKPELRSSETALSGMAVKPAGGLFCANQGEYDDRMIVSAGLTAEGFSGLGITPDFVELHQESITLADSLRLYAHWHDSRLYGPLVNVRRKQLVAGFLHTLYGILCGLNWELAEAAFRDAPHSPQTSDNLQRNVVKQCTDFAAVLRREYGRVGEDPGQTSQWYSELAAQYRVCTDRKLCDFSLRLASEAHEVPSMYCSELDEMLNAIRNIPAILRGARLLMLLRTRPNQK